MRQLLCYRGHTHDATSSGNHPLLILPFPEFTSRENLTSGIQKAVTVLGSSDDVRHPLFKRSPVYSHLFGTPIPSIHTPPQRVTTSRHQPLYPPRGVVA